MATDSTHQRFGRIALIRRFEERLLDLFSRGAVSGTTHTCIGQEADAVALAEHLSEADWLLSSHRCHGHYLARFDDPEGLLLEVLGKEGGVCRGRGGSQHLQRGRFLTNGIQGGIAPVAAGMAMAERMASSGNIAAVTLGDGTLGEGVVYETLNMASLWKLPLLVVVEDNGWAQSTPTADGIAGDMLDRARAFGIRSASCASTDVATLSAAVGEAVGHVRVSREPFWLVLRTFRAGPHSKGDDTRTDADISARWMPDPLEVAAEGLDAGTRGEILEAVEARLRAVEAVALGVA